MIVYYLLYKTLLTTHTLVILLLDSNRKAVSRIPLAADTEVRDSRGTEMIWTLKSNLVRDSVIPKSIKSGGSSYEDHRRNQNCKGQKKNCYIDRTKTYANVLNTNLLFCE